MIPESILNSLEKEMEHAGTQWADIFDAQNTANDWIAYITRYAGLAITFQRDEEQFKTNIIKVIGLGISALMAMEKNQGLPSRHYD